MRLTDEKLHYEEHDDEGTDSRCQHQKWGQRLSILKQLESLACLAIAEHMDVESWQTVCVNAWNRSIDAIEAEAEAETELVPPVDDGDEKPS